MIHEFTIENFRSLRDAVKVDLRVSGSAPDLERYRPGAGVKDIHLPTVSAFVGPNGSGKSTVLRAFVEVMHFIVGSIDTQPNQNIPFFLSFLNKSHFSTPTRFEMIFDAPWLDGEKREIFKYQLSVGRTDSILPNEVIYEALHVAPGGRWKRVFEHKKEEEIYLAKEFNIAKGERSVFKAIGDNRSVISVLARMFRNPFALRIWNDIASVPSNFVTTNPTSESIATHFHNSPEQLEELNFHMRRIDLGISSMYVDQVNKKLSLMSKHDGLDGDVIFDNESNGTKHFAYIFPGVRFVLDTGLFLLVDEFDRDLHPDLAVEILSWFQSPETNPRGAQIFCTLHNTEVLNALEKEELFIVEKDREGVTHVWGAQDVKGLRRDVGLAKKYRQGALGGLPKIG